MRKPLFLFLMLLSCGCAGLKAQDNGNTANTNTASSNDTGYHSVLKPYKWSFGPIAGVGAGGIRSATFADNYNALVSNMHSSTLQSSYAFSYAFGLFLEDKLSERVAIHLGAVYNLFNARYNSSYITFAVDPTAAVQKTTVQSEIRLNPNYLEIPLYLRWVVVPGARLYVLGGASMKLMTGGQVHVSDYIQDFSSKSDTATYARASNALLASDKLDGLTSPTFSGIVGLGITEPVASKPLHIELKAILPFTGGEVYSSSSTIAATEKVSTIFSEQGKTAVEALKGISLNDFKTTWIGLTLSYGLFTSNPGPASDAPEPVFKPVQY